MHGPKCFVFICFLLSIQSFSRHKHSHMEKEGKPREKMQLLLMCCTKCYINLLLILKKPVNLSLILDKDRKSRKQTCLKARCVSDS